MSTATLPYSPDVSVVEAVADCAAARYWSHSGSRRSDSPARTAQAAHHDLERAPTRTTDIVAIGGITHG